MKKKVVFELKDIVLPFTIATDIDTPNILDENLEQIALEKLNEILKSKALIANKIKSKKVKIYDGFILEESQIYPGRIVRTIDNELGIVTHLSISEKGVGVVLNGHRIRYYKPHELLDTKVRFEEARCLRVTEFRENKMWHEGDSGWVFVGGQYHPVVLGKSKRGKYLLHKVTNNPKQVKSWEVSFHDINKYVREFKTTAEQEKYLPVEEIITKYRLIIDNGKNSNVLKVDLVTIFLKTIYAMQPLLCKDASPAFKAYLKEIEDKHALLLDTINLNSNHALLADINTIPNTKSMEA